jgi:hypothetical protein
LEKQGEKKEPKVVKVTKDQIELEVPVHGKEYFFSNVLVKTYQIPPLLIAPAWFS